MNLQADQKKERTEVKNDQCLGHEWERDRRDISLLSSGGDGFMGVNTHQAHQITFGSEKTSKGKLTNYIFNLLFIFFKDFIYFREGRGGRKRGRETSMCGCLSHAPYWGPGRQPRHVPWLGIEPVTLWFTQSTEPHQPGPQVNLISIGLAKKSVMFFP